MTLEEVGKVFGVTRERIRQIEAKALRKLKHPSRRKNFRIIWTSSLTAKAVRPPRKSLIRSSVVSFF